MVHLSVNQSVSQSVNQSVCKKAVRVSAVFKGVFSRSYCYYRIIFRQFFDTMIVTSSDKEWL